MPAKFWDKRLIVARIKAQHRQGIPLNSYFVQKHPKYRGLFLAACKYYGSWKKAVRAAGLNYSDISKRSGKVPFWNADKVIADIKRLAKQNVPLNSGFIQKHSEYRKLAQAAFKYLGSWKKAIEAAGLDYEKIRITEPVSWKWGKPKIIQVILLMWEKSMPLNVGFVHKHHRKLAAAAQHHFGSWQKAIEAAGLDYTKIRISDVKPYWNKKLIVAEIKMRRKQGLPVNANAVVKDRPALYWAANQHFGSKGWNKALRRAGINPRDVNPQVIWTQTKVLRVIKSLYRNGVPVYGYYLSKHGYRSMIQAGEKIFGSWRKTIEAAGLRYADIRGIKKYHWWTQGRIKAQILRLDAKGVSLSSYNISRTRSDLFAAALTYFGSWRKAVYSCDIDYLAHCQHWSFKAWVERLTPEDIERLHKLSKEMPQRRRRYVSRKAN